MQSSTKGQILQGERQRHELMHIILALPRDAVAAAAHPSVSTACQNKCQMQ